jgi:hypothetical protein
VEISVNSMVEIVESDMDVVKVNKFDLKVFKIGGNVYCVEMELIPVLIGMFLSCGNSWLQPPACSVLQESLE